jgi:hypothetical protein
MMTWQQFLEKREAICSKWRGVVGGYEAFIAELIGDGPSYTYRGGGYTTRNTLANCLVGVAPQGVLGSNGRVRTLTRDDGSVVEDWNAELAAIGMEPIPAPAPVPAPALETAAAKAARLVRLRAGFAATVVAHGVVMVEPAMPVFVRLLPDGEVLDVGVCWPDDRGPQPAIGTRVKVSPRGEIEIVEEAK